MTSYDDDEPYRPHGRPYAPDGGYGPSGGSAGDLDPFGAAASGPDGANGAGRTGAAPVSPSTPYQRAGGRASAGSASVPAASGSASVPAASGSAASGSASVGSYPVSPAGGRSRVGRATVRPADFDAAAPGPAEGFDRFGIPEGTAVANAGPANGGVAGRASVPATSGRATVGRAAVLAPADPNAPAGPGGPDGPAGGAPGGPAGKKPPNKKTRRRRRIIAALAVLIMLTGIGVITGVYYTSSVTLPADVPIPQSTTVYYSDGRTAMARLGEQNRQILQDNQIPPLVKQAVTAAEDTTFYSNQGVDFKGIVRALVNNVTGGDTQGASTITQQYVRAAAGLTYSQSYTRKIREIALAMKMTRTMTKDQILDNYLNIVPFGRGAYGIEAAAEAYFNVPASKLQMNQAMVLAGLIKNPNGDVYDPMCGKGGKPCQTAIDRFDYIKAQLPKVPPRPGYLNASQIATLAYPTNAVKEQDNQATNALATPKGFIVHHIMDELSHARRADGTLVFPATGPNSLKNGGYQIVTTINKSAQAAAEKAASGLVKGTPMYGYMKGVGAALVSVQPGSGSVVAYYGGQNGSNIDFAGIYNDPVFGDGQTTNESVTPGSSFKTVTLATALRQGISLDSWWYGPHTRNFTDRKTPVKNSGGSEACPGVGHVCQLWKALQESLNTVYYAVGEDKAQGMSPAKVINMAYDLGLKHLWSGASCKGKRFDLNGSNGSSIWPHCVGADVSFGAYNVTVQDMANVMATFANNGLRADEHFVNYVKQGFGSDARTVYQTTPHLTPVPGYTEQMANDEQWAMQQVYKNGDESDNKLDDDRPAAVKTGTWEYEGKGANASNNQSAFFNGYTAGSAKDGAIATSVWVGYTTKPLAVKDQRGHNISGAGTPAAIWQSYMNAYLNNGPGGHPYPVKDFAGKAGTGDPNAGERTPPAAPSTPAPPQPCDPQSCQPTQAPPPAPPPPSTPPTTAPPPSSTPPSSGGGGGGGGKGGGG
jgi:membrane peptidoglycan carboxypeptidase